MKNRYLLLLLLFLAACSNGEDSPIITIENVFVNGDKENNYAYQLDKMPALKAGDLLVVGLMLNGNGAELKTFKLDKGVEVDTKLIFQREQISSTDLTNEKEGRLRFQDGVAQTNIMVEAVVKQLAEPGDVRLSFYLSSKAECDGAQQTLKLKRE